MLRLALRAEALHSFIHMSQQSYEGFFILMSFSGNWVLPMHMVNSMIDAALLCPFGKCPVSMLEIDGLLCAQQFHGREAEYATEEMHK